MKRFFSLQNISTITLLMIAVIALTSGIKVSVDGVADASFLPITLFSVILSYLLGSSKTSPRRVWTVLLIGGLFFIFFEFTKVHEVLFDIIKYIPSFDIALIQSLLKKEFPDTSYLQAQFAEIASRTVDYFKILLSGNWKSQTLRETIWHLPILLLGSWAGWQVSRRNAILTAMLPLLALHGFILSYTGRSSLSLQIAVFAFITLMGINHFAQQTGDDSRAQRESYSAVLVISFALGIIAGLVPVISAHDVSEKLKENEALKTMLGLEKKPRPAYSASGSGLPRQHLIGTAPENLQTIVFIARTSEPITSNNKEDAPRHYWRWLVYDSYDGQGWATSTSASVSYLANASTFDYVGGAQKVIHQEIRKKQADDFRLYWTGTLLRTSVNYEAGWRVPPASLTLDINPLLQMDMLGALTDAQIYYADSLVPLTNEEQLRASPQTYPEDIAKRYLSLPASVTERTRELANSLTAGMNNSYDKSRAIEAYLRTFPYSLDVQPPPSNQDIADYFLFDLKTGYCDYYATSMIVMLRAEGVPARLVIGYANGDYNSKDETYTIREKYAHSWVEVYFTGIGWVEFEPTASQPMIVLPAGDAQPSAPITVSASQGREYGYAQKHIFKKAFVFPVWVGGVFLFISFIYWFFRSQGLLRPFPTIASIYQYIFHHGGKIYKDAEMNETPSIFAEQLKKRIRTGYTWLIPAYAELDYLTRLYLQEMYSAHPITQDERKEAIRVWRKLFWRLLYARLMRV